MTCGTFEILIFLYLPLSGNRIGESKFHAICVSWAEVIEGRDLLNRATHLGQIKINEHRSN